MIFSQALSPRVDPAVAQRATALIQEVTARLEDRLTSSPFLMGAAPSAADLACVALVQLSMLEPRSKESPIARAFRENLSLGPQREKTRAWVKELVRYDAAQSG
jgi:glutathione S-transferase